MLWIAEEMNIIVLSMHGQPADFQVFLDEPLHRGSLVSPIQDVVTRPHYESMIVSFQTLLCFVERIVVTGMSQDRVGVAEGKQEHDTPLATPEMATVDESDCLSAQIIAQTKRYSSPLLGYYSSSWEARWMLCSTEA